LSNVTINDNIDWDSIKWEFENTKISMRKLAEKYGTYPMDVSRKVKEFGWVKFDPVKKAIEKHEQNKVINPHGILGTTAVRKIQEIVKELGDEYSPVDEPLVVSYAESYERYLRLVAVVNSEGEVCVSPKTGSTYMNPNFSALQSVKSDMAKLGDRLGLSIASRKRLNIALGKEEKTKSLFDLVADISQDSDIDV
jgi:P27 family predicted phage terminase small subunit